MKSMKLGALTVVAIFTVAACGASGTASTGPGSPTTTQAGGTTSLPSAAAPSGPTTTSPAPSVVAVDTCGLISQTDLKTVTGGDFGPGAVDSVGQCTWDGDSSVVLFVQDVPLDSIKSTFPGGEDATVSGQAAYWNPAQGLQSLWVDVGDGRTLVLSFPKSSDLGASDLVVAQKLAEIALGKL